MPHNPVRRATEQNITLYGAGSDYYTTMVLACLIEKKLKYKFYDLEREPGFLREYRFAKLPVVKDGNHLLFEARDIIKHYAKERQGGQRYLLDESGKPNKHVDEWLSVEEEKFYPHANALLCQLLSAKWLAVKPDEGVLRKIFRELEKVLDKYESRLSKNDFLAGKHYSVADLIHLPLIHYIVNYSDGKKLIEGRTNVKKWWEKISGKDNWQKALNERAS